MEDLLCFLEGLDIQPSQYEIECDPCEEVRMRQIIHLHLPNVHITRIQKVNNKFMEEMYLLKKEEHRSRYGAVTEKLLLHATSSYNVRSILQDNFDWRRVTRNKYGKGVSFSDDADYANFHCNRVNGDSRAFIVAKVLVSNCCIGDPTMVVPSENSATAISDNGKVYVKFNDNEFLPVNVVYYNAPQRTSSSHYRVHRRRLPWYC